MKEGKLLSVNVGLPREVKWRREIVLTSIFKKPVEGTIRVSRLNLEGDKQSDLTVHGGPAKAVYVYPSEHYSYWKAELPEVEFPWGAFGENLTTEGLLEPDIQIGDRIKIGSAEFQVTQPRMPCFKLGIRFQRADIVKKFLKSGRSGFYLSVQKEGSITKGDRIDAAPIGEESLSVRDIFHLYTGKKPDRELLRRAGELKLLPDGLRNHFLREYEDGEEEFYEE